MIQISLTNPRWYTSNPTTPALSTGLRPGTLVVYRRAAWRVSEVREIPQRHWPEAYVTAWRATGTLPDCAQWPDRPIAVRLVQDVGTASVHRAFPASRFWRVLPEHYTVCVRCCELPPCRHETTERQVAADMAEAERLMALPPGCCLACGEPVTTRTRSVRLPGPNLLRPDLPDGSAVFHTRERCADGLSRYQHLRKAEDPDDGAPTLDLGV